MAAVTLVGPPEIYSLKSNPKPTPTNDSFIDQMVANFNSIGSNRQPPTGLTENMSPTFLSTGNPCLDFFFHVVPNTPSREGFYAATLWFHQHHPKTLASNVPSLADFGYFKDLPEILYRLLQGTAKDSLMTEEMVPRAKAEKEAAHTLKEDKRIALAKKLLQRVEDVHYAYRVRDRLRKDVLVPLRKVLELPEVFIGANQWGLIPYNRVASVAMKFYKEKFLKHDKERFEKYLEDVKAGKTTIAAGALLPHEIIESLEDGDGGEVAELQWKRIVDDLLKKRKMSNCIAVCDVSGRKVITFSAKPQLHLIQGDSLKSKTEFVRNMHWGMNTDFQKVFDRILDVAVNGKLKEEQMIKRIFVFSDMEFDQASKNSWETDYQAITRKYKKKGYGSCVPQIVFWNLRDSKATPMPATQKGVALVSGFSKNLLTLFLDNEGDISPVEAMEAAIAGPVYQKLVVLD
ncbi:unnamed protein product [Vicia faba]|uniref:Plant/T31B5-30 protein n=1 Tax=Vicia faba TaxID=3906 RepID=A0AAV0YVR2_VICFA|nr:unnamed protein product [Vicia faba]